MSGAPPQLERRLGLLPATALNMANMVGVGPFITIPWIVKEMPGPQVALGWALGLLLALCDAMVWCELGAALPGSGGTFHYLREVFRPFRFARLIPYLFIWQFIFSGPLEVASGCIGFVNYLDVLWPAGWPALIDREAELKPLTGVGKSIASALVALAVLLLYRRIDSIGKLTVVLWSGVLLTVAAVIAAAASGFEPARAFTLPAGASLFNPEKAPAMALGAALGFAMYDFLGYYDICYLGDEVRDAARTIPRAVVISVLAVAAIYTVINFGLLGALPLDTVVNSSAVISDLINSVWGSAWGKFITLMILWTAFASVFALLLGYSRIPFAAARDGYFFRGLADLHPTEAFPRLSLLVLGAVTLTACWFPFDAVLKALLTSRILAQFVAQIGAVWAVRRYRPEIQLPFRMWLYPLPCLLALAGWLYIFGTSGARPILYGLGTLAAGILAFFLAFRPRAE